MINKTNPKGPKDLSPVALELLHLSVWQHVVCDPVESVPVDVVAQAAKQPFEYVETPKTLAFIVFLNRIHKNYVNLFI